MNIVSPVSMPVNLLGKADVENGDARIKEEDARLDIFQETKAYPVSVSSRYLVEKLMPVELLTLVGEYLLYSDTIKLQDVVKNALVLPMHIYAKSSFSRAEAVSILMKHWNRPETSSRCSKYIESFYRDLKDENLRTAFSKAVAAQGPSEKFIEYLIGSLPKEISELSFEAFVSIRPPVSHCILDNVFKRFSNLTKLNMLPMDLPEIWSGDDLRGSIKSIATAPGLSQMKELTMDSPFSRGAIAALSNSVWKESLKSLHLSPGSQKDNWLQNIHPLLSNYKLHSLKLTNGVKFRFEEFLSLIGNRRLSELRVLHLNLYLESLEEFLETIREKLIQSGLQQISEDKLVEKRCEIREELISRSENQLKELHSLTLSCNLSRDGGLGLDEILIIANKLPLNQLKQLELDLSSLQANSSLKILGLSRNLSGLKHLTLNNLYLLEDESIGIITSTLHLETLRLRAADREDISTEGLIPLSVQLMTDKSLEAIANSPKMSQLETLELSVHPQLTDRGIQALTKSPYVKHLKHLSLGECSLTLVGIEAIATSPSMEGLMTLSISNLTGISEESITAIANSKWMSNLEELRILNSDISDQKLKEFASSPFMRRLKVLDFSQRNLRSSVADRLSKQAYEIIGRSSCLTELQELLLFFYEPGNFKYDTTLLRMSANNDPNHMFNDLLNEDFITQRPQLMLCRIPVSYGSSGFLRAM